LTLLFQFCNIALYKINTGKQFKINRYDSTFNNRLVANACFFRADFTNFYKQKEVTT